MSFRNLLQELVVPEGAGPGDGRLVITGVDTMPEPLKSAGFDGAILMYVDDDFQPNAYQYIAWDSTELGSTPFFEIGNVINGAFQLNLDGNRAATTIVNSYANPDDSNWYYNAVVNIFRGLNIFTQSFADIDFKITTGNVGADWSQQRGYRFVHFQTTDLATTLGTPQTWFTLTKGGYQTGRTYLVEVTAISNSSIAGDSSVIILTDGSDVSLPGISQSGRVSYVAAAQGTSTTLFAYFRPSAAGNFTVKVKGLRNSGTGTITFTDCLVTIKDATDLISTG